MADGSLRASAPGEFAQLRLASADIMFGNTAVQDIDTLAIGDVVVSCWVEVLAAFNGGTTNVLTVGVVGTVDKYLAAGDITEATPAVYPAGGKGPFAAEAAAATISVKYVQTGTAATTGSARAYALIASIPE